MSGPADADGARRGAPRLPCVVIFVSAFLIVASTANSIGLTYDEPIYSGRSLVAYEWLRLLARGQIGVALSDSAISGYWSGKDQHPGIVKLVTAVTHASAGRFFGGFGGFRATSALFFAALCVWVFRFLYVFGWQAALFGAGSLCVMPRFCGHAHLLTMDMPVAAMSFLVASAFFRSAQKEKWGPVLLYGVVLGLAAGCKLNALFMPLPLLIWWAMYHRRGLTRYAVATLVVAPAVFILTWPYLWHHTWTRLAEYVAFHMRHYPIPVDYMGHTYLDPPAPWHYPLVMAAITTPTVILASWLVGLYRGLAGQRKPRNQAMVLMVLCAATSMAVVALPGVPKYNGVRLFLPAFPFLSVIGGYGTGWVLEVAGSRLDRHEGLGRVLGAKTLPFRLLPGLLLVPGVWAAASVHPYWLSYYNALVGGTAGAVARGFEPTYWGESYYECLRWLSMHAPPDSLIALCPAGVESTIVDIYRKSRDIRGDLRFTGDRARLPEAEYLVFHARRNEIWDEAKTLLDNGRPAYAAAVQGVPLCAVYSRDEISRVLGEDIEGARPNTGQGTLDGAPYPGKVEPPQGLAPGASDDPPATGDDPA